MAPSLCSPLSTFFSVCFSSFNHLCKMRLGCQGADVFYFVFCAPQLFSMRICIQPASQLNLQLETGSVSPYFPPTQKFEEVLWSACVFTWK